MEVACQYPKVQVLSCCPQGAEKLLEGTVRKVVISQLMLEFCFFFGWKELLGTLGFGNGLNLWLPPLGLLCCPDLHR